MSGIHLVTGGSGYFGSLLAARLRALGHAVRIFDLVEAADRPPGVEMACGDVRDAAAVARACRGVEIVHHNVALVPLARDRRAFFAVNEGGTRNVLAASASAGARKVIYTSSSAVFGVPERNPVTEDMEPRPQEAYGRAKLAGERVCREHAAAGLDVSIVRPRTVLGHGRLGILQILFEWVRQGRNVPVLGRGDNRYQFVHADDLAEVCIRAAERPGFRIYHAGAAEFGTMREALEALVAHAGTGSRVRSVPMAPAVAGMRIAGALGLSPLGPYHALMYGRSMWFDGARVRDELGFAPRWSNAAMLCESYDWYVSNRDAVLAQTGASHHRSPVAQGVLGVVSRLL